MIIKSTYNKYYGSANSILNMPLTQTNTRPDYATAKEALTILKVQPQTLYTYVSRGLVRSISQPGLKDKLYLKEDLERLHARSKARNGHGPAAASAMNWGEPIIPTSITEITPEGPKLRGHNAIELAKSGASFESVTELLWKGVITANHPGWPGIKNHEKIMALTKFIDTNISDEFLEVLASITLHLGLLSGSISERLVFGNTTAAGREIIQTLTGCFGYISRKRCYTPIKEGQSIAAGLTQALSLDSTDENHEIFRSILVILADHELSPGTLAARVAASSGCTLHSCIASAICTSSGVKIGRLYEQVDSFFEQYQTSRDMIERANHLQRQGMVAAGFNHPLYPRGDPRGRHLMSRVQQLRKNHEALDRACEFAEYMTTEHQCHPRHEFAIVALTRSMGLPKQTPAALFVLARIAGWVAHVQEQRLSSMLLRPRAKFITS